MQNNNVTYEFPVRPRPLPNESLEGYLLRLGFKNGRFTYSRIADVVGVRFVDSMFTIDSPAYFSLIEELSCTIKSNAKELGSFFERPHVCLIDKNRYIQNIKLSVPRICPTCFSHEGSQYIKQDWHLAHHTHCEQHGVRLIEQCPCCQYPLKADGTIFNGCAKCGLQWGNYCAVPESIPIYQKVFKTLTEIEKNDYISLLYKALIYMSRPFDCKYESLLRLPMSDKDIVHQFNQAFELITSKSFQNKWFEMRKTKFLDDNKLLFLTKDQINRLVTLPSIELSNYLKVEQSTLLFSPKEDNNYINKYRQKFLVDGTEYSYQISKNTAALLLGLDIKAIDYLLESGEIKYAKKSVNTVGALIHLCEINAFIQRLTKTVKVKRHVGDVDNLISIKKLRKGLRYFNTDLAKLISILINNAIQLYYCSPMTTISIDELSVDRDEITELLEQQFIPSFDEQVSNAKIRDFCFLTKEQYAVFKIKFELSDVHVRYKYSYVSQEKLTDFFTKYMLLNRWVKIHDVKLQPLVKYLDSQPDLIRNLLVNEHNIVLYENSENLTKALNDFLILTSGEPKKLSAFCL